MPIITVGSIEGVSTFYTEKLGFTRVMAAAGEDGHLNFATVMLDGARIMFARARGAVDGSGKRPVDIYLEVANVDAYHAQLEARGVRISEPPTLQWWGDKTFKVMDPVGYEIWFHQKVGVPSPPPGMKIV